MATARKISRQARIQKERQRDRERAAPPAGVVGYDLRDAQLTDIHTITLDAHDETLAISLMLPIGAYEGYAEYDEIIDMEDESLPDYLRSAAKQFSQAALRAVRERQFARGEVPCATCIGACCMIERIHVTDQDVARMEAAGIDVGEEVIDYFTSENFSGHVGMFALTQYPPGADPADPDTRLACPHLRPDGCSIYEHRPLVCREFSPWGCETFEPDPDKVDGKVHLRVTQ